VVFAPLFPLVVSVIPFVGPMWAGFFVNFVALGLAIWFLLGALERWFGLGVAKAAVLAQVTCAGSYAFHAYYAESLSLLAFALALWAYARRRYVVLAAAAAALGASRAVGLVPAVVIAADLARAWWRSEVRGWRGLSLIALALAGSAAYLGFLALRFGNPFVLLPEIQSASWGLFHPPTDWVRVIDGSYLAEYGAKVFARGFDIRTLNFAWIVLALLAIPAGFGRGVPRGAGLVFTAYALAVYALDASSEFLISAHRFAALMTPIFVGGARSMHRLPARAARGVGLAALGLNAGFAVWHAACFNQGWWFWF
jgi:hypothetical protein